MITCRTNDKMWVFFIKLIPFMHSVHQLYQYRKSISTKSFNARGKKVIRCEQCRVSVDHCICSHTPKSATNAGFVLLMYDTEVLKPSNTGRLIADIFDDTFAFLWARTSVDDKLINLLDDPKWQPVIVFPSEYAEQGRECYTNSLPDSVTQLNDKVGAKINGKRPLFILLDGSWREAKKMFKKSPYLNKFPVVSFAPELHAEAHQEFSEISPDQLKPESLNTLSLNIEPSSEEQPINKVHYIRSASKENQLATAQVAANMLKILGEERNAQLLSLWFDVFNYQYQRSVRQKNLGNDGALAQLEALKAAL